MAIEIISFIKISFSSDIEIEVLSFFQRPKNTQTIFPTFDTYDIETHLVLAVIATNRRVMGQAQVYLPDLRNLVQLRHPMCSKLGVPSLFVHF